MDSTESEVPPPSKYASSQSKENTIQLKKMAQAQKQLYKESRNSSSKSKLTTPTNHPQKIDVVKDEISAECNATSDCVAGINLTIDRIGQKLKNECDAMKTEVNSKYHAFKMLLDERTENTTKDIGALKNEYDSRLSRLDAIHQISEKEAHNHRQIEVAIEGAIKELYKKVQFIEQILFTNDDKNNSKLVTATSVTATSVTSTPQIDELGTQRKEVAVKNVSAIKPPDNLELSTVKQKPSTSEKGALDSQKENEVIEKIVSSIFTPSNAVSVSNTSSPSPPESTTLVNVDDSNKPKIDNNLVVADSVQSAGSYSFKINYEI